MFRPAWREGQARHRSATAPTKSGAHFRHVVCDAADLGLSAASLHLWGAIIPNEANPDSDLPRVRDQADSLWPEDRTRNEEARDNGEVQAAERDRRDHRQPAHNGEVADERCVFHKRPDSTNRCLEAAVRPPASERTRMRRHATTSGADGARSDLWSHNIGRRFGSPYLACCFGPGTQREFRRDPIMQAHSQRRLTLSSTSVEAGTPTPEITR